MRGVTFTDLSWFKINLQVVLTKKSHIAEMAPQNRRRRNGGVFMGHLLGGRDGAEQEEIRCSTVHVGWGGGLALYNHFLEYFITHPRHLFTELILQLLKVLTEHFFLKQDNDATVLQP